MSHTTADADAVMVKFNEVFRSLSSAVKDMQQIGYEVKFDFKKNKLTAICDGSPLISLYVDNTPNE